MIAIMENTLKLSMAIITILTGGRTIEPLYGRLHVIGELIM